ncbi:hypothetical protein NSK_004796 [Nannochloropsis salina CCMP1776]|uniref:Sm domain-containing protein n=1 Tax=Nannochloropsis salina CCMP1776 TaxID=1027361 RepID=A0A4D9CWQ3_9STRA|nr:hypothetical protein NSK_004796 [Nannochloropsis salina CCMP1776]|eukprot:TFJ83692.1 hypothetical protein NSK_004796 [Nannochloropsis salina CCMP1776]
MEPGPGKPRPLQGVWAQPRSRPSPPSSEPPSASANSGLTGTKIELSDLFGAGPSVPQSTGTGQAPPFPVQPQYFQHHPTPQAQAPPHYPQTTPPIQYPPHQGQAHASAPHQTASPASHPFQTRPHPMPPGAMTMHGRPPPGLTGNGFAFPSGSPPSAPPFHPNAPPPFPSQQAQPLHPSAHMHPPQSLASTSMAPGPRPSQLPQEQLQQLRMMMHASGAPPPGPHYMLPPRPFVAVLPDYLPGAASLVEQLDRRVLVVLRDGRNLVGVLRSFDQFSNMVLEDTYERHVVDGKYGDLPLGLYLVRGDAVVLLGEVEAEREGKSLEKVTTEEILELLQGSGEAGAKVEWDFE